MAGDVNPNLKEAASAVTMAGDQVETKTTQGASNLNVENSSASPPPVASSTLSSEHNQVETTSGASSESTIKDDDMAGNKREEKAAASTPEPPTPASHHHDRILTADELPGPLSSSGTEHLTSSTASSETKVITVESTNGANGESLQVVTSAGDDAAKSHAQFAAGVVVNKAEMQSFEEWKEMKLKNSVDSATEASTSSPSTPPSGTTNTNVNNGKQPQGNSASVTGGASSKDEAIAVQRRKNYASVECGAKVIASNAESAKPSNILSESKDDYMLNSCSDRIWFVIELCEPIRVTEIELANFELFSNVPRMFKIYASERYLQSASNGNGNWPSKYFVGTFEAMNTRNVQKFIVKDSIENSNRTNLNNENGTNGTSVDLPSSSILMYSKYVRFEMLSHYGTEHYCPLSLVRIFGTSIGDEDEAANDVMEIPSANDDRNVQQASTLLNTNNNSDKPTGKIVWTFIS